MSETVSRKHLFGLAGNSRNRERFEFVNAFPRARIHMELLFRDFHGHTLNLASPPQQKQIARPLVHNRSRNSFSPSPSISGGR